MNSHSPTVQRPPRPLRLRLLAWFLTGLVASALAACSADSVVSLLASGKGFSAKKDFKAAVIQYKKALLLNPGATEARFLLGQTLLQLSDPASAAAEFTRALDEHYPLEQVLPPLAQALLQAGEQRKLTTLYGDRVLQDPSAQASLMTSVASAWAALGDTTRAQTAIGAAQKAVPGFSPAVLLSARLVAGRRDFDGATAEIDRLLALDPSLHEAWQLKGEIATHVGADLKAAEAAFARALSIAPAYAPAHLALIGMRVRERDMIAVKAQAEQMRAVLPKHPLMVFVDAQIAYLDKDSSKARELTQQLLKVAPRHVGALQLAGAIELRDGSLMLAESHLTKALQGDPNSAATRRNLAQIAIRLGQLGKAMALLEPLLRVDSRDAQALALAGEIQLRLNRADLAERHFVQAALLTPADTRVQTALALTHLSRGDATTAFAALESVSASSRDTYADQAIVSARLKRGELDLAVRAVDLMSAKAPKDPATQELRGRVLLARRDLVAARAAFELALVADPALFSATAALASIDVLEKKPQQAFVRLRKSVAAEPRNHYARLALAELHQRTGAPAAEVERLLAETIKAAPTESAPRLRLIELITRQKRFADAVAVAQDAAAALPDDLAILDAVGRTYMEAGEVEQAITTFGRLAAASQHSALPYVRMADVYSATKRPIQAEEALRRALEIEPTLVSAQAALIDLMLQAGRNRELLEMAAGFQSRRPKEPSGYLLEAAVHRRAKSIDAAASALRRGLAATNGRPELAQTLHQMLTSTQRHAEAAQFAGSWLQSHPDDVAFAYLAGVSAISRGDLDGGELLLTRVVAKQSRHTLALNNLAWVLAKRGKPGAVPLAEQAVALSPDNASLVDTLAFALAAERQFDRALETQRRAMAMAPADASLRLGLAKIALSAGDKAVARSELEGLQSLGASFNSQAEVSRLLRQL